MAMTAIAGISALAGIGNLALNASRTNSGQVQNQDLQYAALRQAAGNQRNQDLVEALINQRGIAGQTDEFGSGFHYDPATNQWISSLGPLPKAAQTAAMQAAISRNTTDLRQAQFENEQNALRAARNQPAADTAARNIQTFRPMQQNELVGLLQQQATNAQQQTFRPMIADTLRQFARTGTSAGPVLGQIGRDENKSLRDSLIDAQIKGMTGVTDINTQRRQGLEQSAADTQALATPQFTYPGLSGSNVDNTMAQVIAQRAQGASISPAYGAAAANKASEQLQGAFKTAGSTIADPNYGLNSMADSLKNLQTLTGSGGSIKSFIDSLSGSNKGNYTGTTTQQDGYTLPKGLQMGTGYDQPSFWPGYDQTTGANSTPMYDPQSGSF